MSTSMVTPEQARQVANQLFLNSFPTHATWFDLAWDCSTNTIVERGSAIDLSTLPGLAAGNFADPLTRRMAEQFANLAATFLIHSPVARDELLARLQENTTNIGQPDALVEWLIQSARQTLDQLSQVARVLVTVLLDGECSCDREWDYDEFQNGMAERKYDFVVDERSHLIDIKMPAPIKPMSILNVPKMQRGMLWLVLTHVGQLLEHKKIGERFGFKTVSAIRSVSGNYIVPNRIYQYRIALRKLVGNGLCNRMLQKGADHAYVVTRSGWSFAWIRENIKVSDSELLHGLSKSG